jgi:WD40 repeat protein
MANLNINKIAKQIERELTCKFCQKYLELPVKLDCGQFICRNDLEKRLIDVEGNKSFKKMPCTNCKQFHYYDMEMNPCFLIDKEKTQLLKEYLNKPERTHAKNLINEINEKSSIEYNETDRLNYINSYFQNMKSEVLLQSSLFEIRTKYLCESLMKSIEDYEKKCKTDEVNQFTKINFNPDQWFEELRKPCTTDSRLNNIIQELEQIKNDANAHIKKFENQLLSKACEFVAFDFDLLGCNFLGELKPITVGTLSQLKNESVDKSDCYLSTVSSNSRIPDDLANINVEDLFKADCVDNEILHPLQPNQQSHLNSDREIKKINIEEYSIIDLHSSPVHTIKHISDDLYASGSQNNEIIIWNLSNPINFFSPKDSGHTDSIECLAVSNDKRTLISGSFDNTIKLWSLYDQDNNINVNHLATLEGHLDRVI